MLDFVSQFKSPGPFVEKGERGLLIGEIVAGMARASLDNKQYEPDPFTPAGIVLKAVSGPANTTNSPLHRQALAEFQDAIAYESALLKLEPKIFELDVYASVVLPYRDNSGSNLAGGFRQEGAAIRVGGLAVNSRKLVPHSLSVIVTATNEALESAQGLEKILHKAAIEDTAAALDRHAFSNSPAVPGVSPPGLLLGAIKQAQTAPHDAIRALVTAVAPQAKRPILLMNKATRVGIEFSLNAQGGVLFPELNTSGFCLGVRVINCNALADGRVVCLDADALAMVLRLDSIKMASEGLIHEEDVVPMPIVDGAGAVASPVRELFSSNTSAIRFVWSVDFAWTRPQAITYADITP